MTSQLHIKSYRPQLDGLRGVSILLVLLNHWTHGLYPFFEFFRQRGHLGVEVFFAISGFLVMGSLHTCFLKTPDDSMKVVGQFFVRRLARIFIPYFLLLFSVFVLGYYISSLGDKLHSISDIAYTFPLYLYNYGKAWTVGNVPGSLNISWSLCFEEQFYLILAALFFFCRSHFRKYLWILCLFSIFFRLYQAIVFPDLPFFQMQMETHRRFDAILWGVLLYMHWPQVSNYLKAKKMYRFLILAGVSIVFSFGVIWGSSFNNAMVFTGTAFFFTGLMAVILIFDKSFISQALRFFPLVFLGKISYEVYLLHQVVNGVASKLPWIQNSWSYGLIYFGGTFVLSTIFYFKISSPSQKWIRRT